MLSVHFVPSLSSLDIKALKLFIKINKDFYVLLPAKDLKDVLLFQKFCAVKYMF